MRPWFAWLGPSDLVYCDDEEEARGLVESHLEDAGIAHQFGIGASPEGAWGQVHGRIERTREAVVCPECGEEDDNHEPGCVRPDLQFTVDFEIITLEAE